MDVFFKPKFRKDLEGLPHDIRLEVKRVCIEIFPTISNLRKCIYAIKPISGFKNYYRLRLGDYRIGFKLEGVKIIFMRVKHRKDIYRYFP